MHVLLIHQAFASPQEAGGTRHFELARHMVDQGHLFTIVASDLSYVTGRQVVSRRGVFAKQEVAGVRVMRAYTYPSLHRSFGWRVISFFSFMLSSVWTSLQTGRVDLVMGTSPPIFQAVSAWLVATLRRRPFLLEIRDLWPDFAIDIGVLRNPVLIALSGLLERFLYARANHIMVNSPAYRDHLIGEGIPAHMLSLIPNGVDPSMFDPHARGERVRQELGLNGRFVVAYAGALGLANDIPTILRAAARLKDRPDIHVLLVGDGKERPQLENLARRMGLFNVTFAGARPKSEIPELLAASDACVATLQDIPMFRTTYPNKVFDYMAAGRPTVLAIDGVIRDVIESAQGGTFVQPGNPEALAEGVLQYYKNPELRRQHGLNARSYVAAHFDRKDQGERLRGVFESLSVRSGLRRGDTAVKRVFDIVFSAVALVFLCPLIAAITLAILLTMGRPVLYLGARPGLGGRIFRLYKFRTMSNERGPHGRLLPDAKRLTPLGRFLRRLSLDELPQLWNVLKGDMSLVGPRPLLVEYLNRYTPTQARRHEVRPGITGWAQVNGRNALTWQQKFDLDVWYVDHRSPGLDMKVMLLTLIKVFRREGITQPGHATMEEFLGSPPRRACESAFHIGPAAARATRSSIVP